MDIDWKVRVDDFAGRKIVFLIGRSPNYEFKLAIWVEDYIQTYNPADAFMILMERVEAALVEAELNVLA